jgi:hypothetical protein
MPLDPRLLAQVLRTPRTQDVTRSPIVTAIVLRDPANAADLVEALETARTLEAYNARLILCEFQADAVPSLVARLATAGPNARREGLDVMWAMLVTENRTRIRNTLQSVKDGLNLILDDKTPLPDDLPPHIERDFQGRICDLAYIRIQLLLSPRFDQSFFRGLDNAGRDREIAVLKRKDFSLTLA